MAKEMTEREIFDILVENQKIVTSGALNIIKEKGLLERVLEAEQTMINEKVLKTFLEPNIEIERTRERKASEEYEIDFRIENADITHRERKASDFVSYFNSKFLLLQQMLVKRVNPVSINNISKISDEVSIIGMVTDIRVTGTGNKIIELEDPTGSISCMVTKNGDETIIEESNNLLLDEVVGIRGFCKHGYVFVKEIIRPDIPVTNELKKLDAPLGCVFISDLHVGSVDFIEHLFERFIKWLNSAEAEKVKYIFIAGDLVEGIGIYQEQEAELSAKTGDKQYEILVEHLRRIPEHIKIVVQPGNHDTIGNHEPQITLKDTPLSKLTNVMFGTNPCSVVLDKNFRILMYHGYSYDDVIRELPAIRQEGYRKPCLPMKEVLKRRHLAPFYGSSLVIPEHTDKLVIDEVPDIFHSGHLHTVGLESYKNVLMINSGTFQGRTKFQEMMGHIPHPGIFAYVDLQTRESKLINLN